MAYPRYIRDKARAMRRERRMTLDEIATRLALPRGTVWSLICDIEVHRDEFDARPRSEAQRRAARANSERARQRRQCAYERGVEEFSDLACDPRFRDFVCLYLAEGSKRDRNMVAICNSDPSVMALSDEWMKRFARRKLDYAVQHHADQEGPVLQEFWASVLGIDPSAVVLHLKSNSGQLRSRTWRCVHGVMTIRSCDTLFRARMGAWIDCLKRDWQ